jgi:hypothetical protein
MYEDLVVVMVADYWQQVPVATMYVYAYRTVCIQLYIKQCRDDNCIASPAKNPTFNKGRNPLCIPFVVHQEI